MASNYSGGAKAPKKRKKRPHLVDRGNQKQQRGHVSARPPAFGNNEKVKGGVAARARRRYRRLGGDVEGVNPNDGFTGQEARKLRDLAPRGGKPFKKDKPQKPQRRSSTPRKDPFADQVNALAQLQYGPQERELQSQGRIEAQRGVNQQAWYANYLKESQAALAAQASYTKGFQDAAYQQANMAAGMDQQANAQLLNAQQQSANIRGTTVDPNVAQTLQQGAAARQAQTTSQGTLLANQGQAQTNYLAGRVMTAAGEGVQAQQDVLARQRKVESLTRELMADKAAFKVSTRADLQDQAHKQRLEEAAFGLKSADTLADNRRMARSDRALNRDRRRDNRRMAQADRERARHNRQTEAVAQQRENRMAAADLADDGKLNGSRSGGKSPSGKYTQSQRNSNQKSYRRARTIGSGIKGDKEDVIRFLTNKKGIDPLVARAAVAPSSLSARQRHELRRMGIKTGKRQSLTEIGNRGVQEGASLL